MRTTTIRTEDRLQNLSVDEADKLMHCLFHILFTYRFYSRRVILTLSSVCKLPEGVEENGLEKSRRVDEREQERRKAREKKREDWRQE
jgi:hypothetical protein